MPGLGRSTGAIVAALTLASPAAAPAASFPPDAPPRQCQGSFFSDQIGTNVGEVLQAARRPERLWGRAGPDVLYGSATRATCLLGGRDPDVLDLGAGGGLAWGEHGSDLLVGSALDDGLDGGEGNDAIEARGGRDNIMGGDGLDGIDAGPGDDLVNSADERPEIVQCGAGDDVVLGDRVDVLIGCEVLNLDGPDPVRLIPSPRAARRDGIVRVRFRVPETAGAGAYRVLLVTGPREPGCAAGPLTLTSLPAAGRVVRAGVTVRVGLRPPPGGWCAGPVRAAVVLDRPCRAVRLCAVPPPGEPIARLTFQAG